MKKLLVITTALLFIAPSAFASPLNANNMELGGLQSIFSDTLKSTINVNTEESGAEIFAFQSTGATAHYVANVAPNSSNIEFGIYDLANPDNQLTIFNSTNNVGDNTQIYIDYNGSSLMSYSLIGGYTPIDTITMDLPNFGFYITSSDGTYYSVSADNPTETADLDGDGAYDNDHFLAYEGNGDKVNLPLPNSDPTMGLNDYAHWYIAVEGSALDGTNDNFTDMLVHFESIQPVPEPATFVLFGFGMLGVCGLLRRK